MKRFFFLLTLMVLAITASAQDYEAFYRFMDRYSSCCPSSHAMNSVARQQIGQPVGAYNLNRKYNSKTLKGRFAIMNFWATWCGGCRLLNIDLDSLMIKTNCDEFRDVAIIGVNAHEDMASKGLDPEEWWVNHRMGFPTIGGKNADAFCEQVKGTHPSAILIDDRGIIRGRWDAWSTNTGEFIRFAVWALHVMPRDGIKADSATVEQYLAKGRYIEANYLLTLMPEKLATAALRFRALMQLRSEDAIAYYKKLKAQYEVNMPKDFWEEWKVDPQYVTFLAEASDYLYHSTITDRSLLQAGLEMASSLLAARGQQTPANRTKHADLTYRYGQAMVSAGEGSLLSVVHQSGPDADVSEAQALVKRYGIDEAKYDYQYRPKGIVARDDAEIAESMRGLNDTIDLDLGLGDKVEARLIVPQKLRPGKTAHVSVSLHMAKGWHGYADNEKNRNEGYIPTAMTVTLPKGFTLGECKASTYGHDGLYEGSTFLDQIITVPEANKLKGQRSFPVTVELTVQICNGGSCLPPVTITRQATMKFKE